MAKINQIYKVINDTQKQAWGKEAVDVIDTKTLIALGDHIIDSADSGSKDKFTGALTDIIGKTIFVSRALTGKDLGISRDNIEWGAILRKVRVKPIDIEHNEEYDLTPGADTSYINDVKVPELLEQLYSKHTTYKSQITITDKQLFTAFSGDSELMSFYSLLFKQLEDSMVRAQMSYDRLALANFIAEKIKLQGTQPTKTHAINLIQTFYDETGVKIDASEVWTNQDFLKHFASKVVEYKNYMNTDSDVFNASVGYPSQTPDEYMNFYTLSLLDSKLAAYLYADTYHKEMVKVDGYKTVDFWQGIKGSTGPAFAPEAISTININPASGGTAIEKSGILAVMVDKDAVVSTYQREASESWRVPLKGTNHAKHMTHMYINDVNENGLVFYVEDIEVE